MYCKLKVLFPSTSIPLIQVFVEPELIAFLDTRFGLTDIFFEGLLLAIRPRTFELFRGNFQTFPQFFVVRVSTYLRPHIFLILPSRVHPPLSACNRFPSFPFAPLCVSVCMFRVAFLLFCYLLYFLLVLRRLPFCFLVC